MLTPAAARRTIKPFIESPHHGRADAASNCGALLTSKCGGPLLEVCLNAFFVVLRSIKRPPEPLIKSYRLLEAKAAPEIHHLLHPCEPKWAATLHRSGEKEGGVNKLLARHDSLNNTERQRVVALDLPGGEEDLLRPGGAD
jgi:hypothetical protein